MTLEEARRNLKDLELREFAYNHAAGCCILTASRRRRRDAISRGKTLSVLNEEYTNSRAARPRMKR